jgi:DNA-binding CsgD family transcriptional regulator
MLLNDCECFESGRFKPAERMYAPAMGRARKFVPPGQQWTPRHVEVLNLLARGRTNPEIAETLGITLDGAKYHIREILSALGAGRDQRALAIEAKPEESCAPAGRSLGFARRNWRGARGWRPGLSVSRP